MGTQEYFFKNLQLTDLNIYNIGRSDCPPGWSWGPAIRNHFLLVYILSGRGSYTADKKRRNLTAGDIFLLKPLRRAEYAADLHEPWEYIWISFQGSLADRLFTSLGGSVSVSWGSAKTADRKLSNSAKNFSGSIVEMVNDAAQENLEGELKALGRFIALFPAIHSALDSGKNIALDSDGEIGYDEVNARKSSYAAAAKEFIHRNFAQQISVSSIAQYIGLERSYFSIIFKKETGLSPGKYLLRYRMRLAWKMLELNLNSIETVSNSVGFLDTSSFSRAFKRIYGLPPSSVVTNKNHPT